MKCLICGTEMEPGGIIAGSGAMWFPMKEFQKKGLKKLMHINGQSIGKEDFVFGMSKIENAHYCSKCNKVMGIFDVNPSWTDIEAKE